MAMAVYPPFGRGFKGFCWEGKSELDGTPIVVVFTGFSRKSKNVKTGVMIQSWILRSDIDPLSALRSGEDSAICGNCRHRPILGGKCYVSVARAPLAVWKAWKRGAYVALDLGNRAHLERFYGRILRLGSYGDPVSATFSLWATLLSMGKLAGHTGYTHQWRLPIAQRFKAFLMASVDSELEAQEALSNSWRYFRVSAPHEIPQRLEREINCPASAEMGHRLTCETCKACSGNLFGRSNVVIAAHGFRIGKTERN